MNRFRQFLGVLCCAGSLGALATTSFTASFDGYRAGEPLGTTKGATGGRWSTSLGCATNVSTAAGNRMRVDGRVRFDASQAQAENCEQVDFQFFVDAELSEGPPSEKGDLGGFAVCLQAGVPTPFVWGEGQWQAYPIDGCSFAAGDEVQARMEVREIAGFKFVSYLVRSPSGTWLRGATAEGRSWFKGKPTATRRGVSFFGQGDIGSLSGTAENQAQGPVRVWTGGAAGEWENPANWREILSGDAALGTFNLITNRVALTWGGETADVSFWAQFDGTNVWGADFATTVSLKTTRPRVGKTLEPTFSNFRGLRPHFDFSWSLGSLDKVWQTPATCETFTPSATAYENWIRFAARQNGREVYSKEFFFSKLPVCYLSTDDGATPSENKEEHAGHLLVQGNDEFKGGMYDGAMTIKVRGNSTRKYVKKPYKIRLDEKTKMFGLGKKNRHWVLLANYNDMSQLRNKLAYDFANEIGMLGMRSTWVDCVLNGEFIGCYQFCEHIRVAEDRVNIFNWEDFAEDAGKSTTNLSWIDSARASDPSAYDISGGYLFEFSDENDEVSGFTISAGLLKIPTMVHAPEYVKTSPQMFAWCKSLLQNFFTANVSLNHLSGEGRHWSWYADVDSMVNYWLDVELFGNKDPRFKSRYAYIDIGGKMKMGPVWDFDWGSDSYVVSGDCSSDPEAWSCTNGPRPSDSTWKNENAWVTGASFLKEWTSDPYFLMKAYERYWEIREKFVAVIEEGGVLDQSAAFLKPVLAANDARWPRTRGNVEDTSRLRSYYRRRLPWLDRQFKSVPKLMASLAVDWQTTPYVVDPVRISPSVDGRTYAIRAQLQQAATVEVFVNGERLGAYHVVDGRFGGVRVPRSLLTPRVGKLNCISFISYSSTGVPVARNYLLVPTSPAGTTLLLR